MKMSEVKVGMKLRDPRDPSAPDVRVTMLTERGFQYLLDRPVMIKTGEYDYGQVIGGEHFGANGEALYDLIPTPAPVFTPPAPPSPVDRSARTLTDGRPVTLDHTQIDPATGQQKSYVVLSEEERAKGFVRPVRDSYRHVGPPPPKNPLRDLTAEEVERYKEFGYVKYEAYPESESSVVGKFWTRKELDRARGCGAITTMGRSLAETYARDPGFYGGTFCVGCKEHFPVGKDGEFMWQGTTERVGT